MDYIILLVTFILLVRWSSQEYKKNRINKSNGFFFIAMSYVCASGGIMVSEVRIESFLVALVAICVGMYYFASNTPSNYALIAFKKLNESEENEV